MLTWSLGCALRRPARLAITSLAFMFDEVPEPVWKTSIGNWSSCSPAATASPATAIALRQLGVEQAEIGVGASSRGLDLPQPTHERHGYGLARYREVADCLFRFATPEVVAAVVCHFQMLLWLGGLMFAPAHAIGALWRSTPAGRSKALRRRRHPRVDRLRPPMRRGLSPGSSLAAHPPPTGGGFRGPPA